MDMEQLQKEVMAELSAAGDRLGAKGKVILKEDQKYAGDLLKQLAKAYGKPGFDEGVEAAYDAIKLRLAIDTCDLADEADLELRAFGKGLLTMAIKFLVAV